MRKNGRITMTADAVDKKSVSWGYDLSFQGEAQPLKKFINSGF